MDISARRRKPHLAVQNNFGETYVHDINLYSQYPETSVPLWEFEDLALERLQLLRILEQATLKGNKIYTDAWKQCVKDDLLKVQQLKKYVRLLSGSGGQTEADIQARRADHISHFILLLAYCRSEDLRRWFLSRELEWFRLRFMIQTPQSVRDFLKANNFEYFPISNEEKQQIKNELITATFGMSEVACETSDFYKVPFTEVLPLIRNRKVFVRKGFAFVSLQDLVVCVQSKLRTTLSENLNAASHRLPLLDDDRLTTLLKNIHLSYTGKDYNFQGENKDAINPAMLDELSKKHFPICMRSIHELLKSTHHLKHQCRLQYGLFIKGIGVLYDDAMEFWRQEFTKTMDANSFEKNYAYNVKHMYGKVGNMTSYSPYSCIKIITNSVGVGEHHGCPFRHWDSASLRARLVEHGTSVEGVQAIMELVQNGHFQIACTKYFEYSRGQAPSQAISHPNQYFEESVNLTKQKQIKKN